MPVVKLNLSFDPPTAELIRTRALAQQKQVSVYVAELARAEARRAEDALAAEGYRVLSEDTGSFAATALELSAETWPEWGSKA